MQHFFVLVLVLLLSFINFYTTSIPNSQLKIQVSRANVIYLKQWYVSEVT